MLWGVLKPVYKNEKLKILKFTKSRLKYNVSRVDEVFLFFFFFFFKLQLGDNIACFTFRYLESNE